MIKIKTYDYNEDGTVDINEQDCEEQDKQDTLNDGLTLYDYSYFENLKKDKNYVVDGLIRKGELIMFYGAPKSFKSLLIHYLSICVTRGLKFFGLKTKRCPILISDKENNSQLIKDRWKKLRRALNIRRKKFSLYYLSRTEGDFFNNRYIQKLHNTIQKEKIGLVIFDTLHRHADYDENSANDINQIYTTIFNPILEMGCSILYIHHTNKTGEFRGSVDFKGSCDGSLKIFRPSKASNKFTLTNEDNRWGELEEINGDIDFTEDKIIIKEIIDTESIEVEDRRDNVVQEISRKILTYFTEGNSLLLLEIKTRLDNDNYHWTESSLKRSINSLVERGQLIRESRGNYRKTNPEGGNENENNTEENR